MSFIRTSEKYTMNTADASRTLQNVLEACDKTSSTPLDEVLINNESVVHRHNSFFIIVVAALALTLLAPILFVAVSKSPAAPDYKPDIAVESFNVSDGYLDIDFDGSLIDYNSIYAVKSTGETIHPVKFNYRTGLVTFEYDETEWNLFVSDLNQVTLHLLLTPPL